jgi:hypothetical protein
MGVRIRESRWRLTQKERVRTRTWGCLQEQGKKACFDSAAVVRGVFGRHGTRPGVKEGLR